MRLMHLVHLRKLEGGDWPLAIVAFDGNSQAMPFVEPNVLHRPSLSVGKDHRLAKEFGLSLFERAEDGRGTKHHWGHDCIRMDARLEWGLFALERAKVVTGAGRAGSPPRRPRDLWKTRARRPEMTVIAFRSSPNCDLARGNRFPRSELIVQGAANAS